MATFGPYSRRFGAAVGVVQRAGSAGLPNCFHAHFTLAPLAHATLSLLAHRLAEPSGWADRRPRALQNLRFSGETATLYGSHPAGRRMNLLQVM